LTVITGCAGRQVIGTMPPQRHAGALDSPDDVFGFPVRVRMDHVEYNGELLGCDAQSVYLSLNLREGPGVPYARVPMDGTSEIRIEQPSAAAAVVVWGTLGLLSTISHGLFAVGSAPAWAVATSGAAAAAWNPGHNFADCDALRPYARFPQGVPVQILARFIPNTEQRLSPIQVTGAVPASAAAPIPDDDFPHDLMP
jgi:hypothetical protein